MADQKELVQENVQSFCNLNEDAGKSAEPEHTKEILLNSDKNVQDCTPVMTAREHNEYIMSVVEDFPLLPQFSIEQLQSIYKTCYDGERDLMRLFLKGGQRSSHALVITRNMYMKIRCHVARIIQNHPGYGK